MIVDAPGVGVTLDRSALDPTGLAAIRACLKEALRAALCEFISWAAGNSGTSHEWWTRHRGPLLASIAAMPSTAEVNHRAATAPDLPTSSFMPPPSVAFDSDAGSHGQVASVAVLDTIDDGACPAIHLFQTSNSVHAMPPTRTDIW